VAEKTLQADDSRAASERLLAVVDQAKAGDASAIVELRQFMDNAPALAGIYRGDAAEVVEDWMVRIFCPNDHVRREATLSRLNRLRRELEGPDPTALERLLVQRIVVCWLRLQIAEMNAGTHGADSVSDIFQRHMERASRLFESAVKTLATVRRMATPVLVGVNLTARAEGIRREPALPLKIRGTAGCR
jgi:hypothetical protein